MDNNIGISLYDEDNQSVAFKWVIESSKIEEEVITLLVKMGARPANTCIVCTQVSE